MQASEAAIDKSDNESEDSSTSGMHNGKSHDLTVGQEATRVSNIADPMLNEPRATTDAQVQDRLSAIRDEFTFDPTKMTEADKIHEENVKQGRDKFKTLRQIRQGNTKRRVDYYEAM